MAVLVHGRSGVRFPLVDRVLVGRSSACHLRLAEGTASAEHAILAWSSQGWVVRDLMSRNGTFLDGERLAPGVDTALPPGAVLGFGGDDGWRLDGADPPAARATGPAGEAVEGTHDLLVLPDEAAPELLVYRAESGRWRVAGPESDAEVASGDVVRTESGAAWTLVLPVLLAGTVERDEVALSAATLVFGVSADEEHVELRVRTPRGSQDLGARASNHVLLLLARARVEDAASGLPARSQGWRYSDDVQRMLRLDRVALNVAIHRARRHLAAAGLRGGGGIVERRTGTHQLRLAEVGVVVEAI